MDFDTAFHLLSPGPTSDWYGTACHPLLKFEPTKGKTARRNESGVQNKNLAYQNQSFPSDI